MSEQIQEHKSSILTTLLATLVLVLSFVTAAVVLHERMNGGEGWGWRGGAGVTPEQVEEQAQPQIDPEQAWRNKTDKAIADLDRKVTLWGEKVWLLSLAFNENSYLNNQAHIRRGGQGMDYIYFEKDWKLNHAPQFIKVPESDRPILERHLSNEVK